ncbi:MAG: molybdopterin biosynthesis protein [Bacillota bacterium]
MSRKLYLNSVPPSEALARLQAALRSAGYCPGPAETVPVAAAAGRVLAAPAIARLSSPSHPAAAMDGVAVRAAVTRGASEASPLKLVLGRDAIPVDTGDVLPPGADAVIMAEDLHETAGHVEIMAAAAPWQHVRPIGEDVVASEVVVPQGQRLSAYDLGALLAAGLTDVEVRRRPLVTIIPTGTELVEPGAASPAPGAVIEFNSRMLGALISEWGGEARRAAAVADDPEALQQAVSVALAQSDMVVVNAGSSAGREDFTAPIIARLGEVLVHGVATRPGKPVILGVAGGKPVFGLPGYPVSCAVAADLFIKPVIAGWLGVAPAVRERLQARLARRVISAMGIEEHVRVTLARVGQEFVAVPLPRGAGVVSSLSRADGLLVVAPDSQGAAEGSLVTVELFRPVAQLEHTVSAVGSHDILLDLLDGELRAAQPGWRLASAHVGSLAGILAIGRGEAHLAGVHLLDEETGQYNTAYVQRHLGDGYRLVHLAWREQGLMVPRGNPMGVKGLDDLRRVSFINRQRGSGTRVLLDYSLRRLGICPDVVEGYAREEFTHLAVAAAVQGGSAEAGLGIKAAADAFGLEFVPVGRERYDLIVAPAAETSAGVTAVLAIIADPGFRQRAEALGGYDLSESGREWEL